MHGAVLVFDIRQQSGAMLGLNDKPGFSASAKHAAFSGFSCLSKRNGCLSSTAVRAKHAKLASDSVLASKPTGGLSSLSHQQRCVQSMRSLVRYWRPRSPSCIIIDRRRRYYSMYTNAFCLETKKSNYVHFRGFARTRTFWELGINLRNLTETRKGCRFRGADIFSSKIGAPPV